MLELAQSPTELKTCCANLYQSDWAKVLLGDSFHPGGLALTRRLGNLLNLQPGKHVLDVAAGKGTSAIFLAQQFGCRVTGVDFGVDAVTEANANAEKAGVAGLIQFKQGDAENLHFDDGSFDAIICECAFCIFPNKPAAAQEFARVLRSGGQVGLSDLTRSGKLPPELDTLLAWIACIADAQPAEDYTATLEHAGFTINQIEPHNMALAKMVRSVQGKLLGAEVMLKLDILDLPDIDLSQAKSLVKQTSQAVQDGKLGYTLITGKKDG